MKTLPIVVAGRTVNVPCRLPESFDFQVFLPSRGVRAFTAWLTTTDPCEAEVKDVQLSNREGDPRAGLNYDVDDDEQKRADEAAGDVLADLLTRLRIPGPNRLPIAMPEGHALVGIGYAWQAEVAAYAAQASAIGWFRAMGEADYADDIARKVLDINAASILEKSAACEALRCFVAMALDEAVTAASERAERQRDEHLNARSDDPAPSGSEVIRNERHLDARTLNVILADFGSRERLQ